MKAMDGCRPGALMAMALSLAVSSALAQDMAEGTKPLSGATVHTVKPGETLWGISKQHFGQPWVWPEISKRNAVGEPRRLQPGKVLAFFHVDAAWTHATVFSAVGDVRIVPDASGSVAAAVLLQPGMPVPVGSLVRTGPDSFLTLVLPDGSHTTLPSNSSIRLVQLLDAQGRRAVLLDLVQGNVESRVQPNPAAQGLKGSTGVEPYRVRTRMGTVAVRGTHFRVNLPESGGLAVGVLESRVLVSGVSNTSQAPDPTVVLDAGQGVVAEAGQTGGVQALLPAPELLNAGQPQVQPNAVLVWKSVPGAQGYRVQMALDREFLNLFAEQRLQGADATMAVVSAVPEGDYFARITAFTPQGLEGLYTLTDFARTQALLGGRARLASDESIEFAWSPVPGGVYQLELARDAGFTDMVLTVPGLQSELVHVQALSPGQYYWRVRAQVYSLGQRSEVLSTAVPLVLGGAR